MALVSMKVKKENEMEMPNGEYGYGTMLHLEEDQVSALGITELPEVGTVMKVSALAVVTKTMLENDGEGEEKMLCLQITDMELTKDGQKNQATIMFGEDE